MAFKPDEWSTDGVPIIRIVNLNGGDDFNCFEGNVNERYHVEEGDLLFGWSGNRGTSFGPFLWWRPGLHYLNQHIFKLTDYRDDKCWFYWALKAVTGYIEEEAHGIIGMVHVTKGRLGAVKMPVPPRDEQQAIARFLDEQTKKIDDLIEAKRDLLALLKEKRQAVISHAVTKGLNPDARLKPSGVDWLGDVPEHWEVKPLKYIASIKTGFAFSSDDFVDEGVPLLRIGDIGRDGKVHMDAAKHLPINYIHRYRDFLISSGDIVMAMTGATIGKAGRYNANSAALLNQRVCSISALTKDRQDFLWFLLNAPFYMEYILLTAFGGAQPNISDKELLDCSAPVPPCDEQHAIAEYLNAKTAKIDRLSAEVETASDRLRDYRTALISAAVTGKIDVRGGAT
jgi:type I restriction enzyme S subunit